MSHVNIVKKIKIDGDWKLLSIPRNAKGNYDWNALPEGLYLIEWRAGGKRRRESAGVTAAQALEAQRRKRHELEGRKLGVPGFELAGETPKTPALHIAVHKYLAQIEALKKPNTHRKYEAVLDRFVEFFRDKRIDRPDRQRRTDPLHDRLKKDHNLGANTILHNAIIVAQFFKRQGEVRHDPRAPIARAHHTACHANTAKRSLARSSRQLTTRERALFSTFLLTGLREMEVVHLFWTDISFELQTVRVTAKPDMGFYPKRWEEREVPIPVKLIDVLKAHTRRPGCNLVFPSPAGIASTTCSTTARPWPSVPDSIRRGSISRHSGRPIATRRLRAGSTSAPCSTGWDTSRSKPRCDTWSRRRKCMPGWTR